MPRTLFRRPLAAVVTWGRGVILAAMAAVAAVAAVAKQMHGDHPGEEQHPNPVLGKPVHELTPVICGDE